MKTTLQFVVQSLAALLVFSSATGAALASSDHDLARQALQSGEILPLDKILASVAAKHPGQVLEVELDRERYDGKKIWIYEIKSVTRDGKLLKLEVDAKTGEVLQVRSKSGERKDASSR